MSPLKIRLLLELHYALRPDLEYPACQWFAPAMRTAFSDFRQMGLTASWVRQDTDWSTEQRDALTPLGLALVKRLKEVNP